MGKSSYLGLAGIIIYISAIVYSKLNPPFDQLVSSVKQTAKKKIVGIEKEFSSVQKDLKNYKMEMAEDNESAQALHKKTRSTLFEKTIAAYELKYPKKKDALEKKLVLIRGAQWKSNSEDRTLPEVAKFIRDLK